MEEGPIEHHGWIDALRPHYRKAASTLTGKELHGLCWRPWRRGGPSLPQTPRIAGRNGWLVPVKDHSRLGEAMLQAASDAGRIVLMRIESRKLAEANFDVLRANESMLSFMGLLDARRAADSKD